MKRKAIQAAALLPASQDKGRETSLLPPVHQCPFQVDLADPDAARHIGDSVMNLFVRLEERFPADPGELSGVSLRILESGKCTVLDAENAAPQRDGLQGTHVLGYLTGAELAYVGAANPKNDNDTFLIRLRESHPRISFDSYSGVILALNAGKNPELSVYFDSHCLGVLRGRLVAMFLKCVRQRCEMETA